MTTCATEPPGDPSTGWQSGARTGAIGPVGGCPVKHVGLPLPRTILTCQRCLALAFLLLCAAALPACGSSASTPATGTVTGHTFRMADAPDLSWVQNLPEVVPQFELTPDIVPTPLIFATVRADSRKTADPVIIRKEGTTWRIQEVTDLHQHEWVYAAVAEERSEVWAIADGAPGLSPDGARAPQLTLLRSTDAGETWTTFSAIRKPNPAAEFDSFHLTPQGHGRITLHLDADAPNGVRAGIYQYRTTDGGKTWSGPEFDLDDLDDATHSTGSIPDTLHRIQYPG